MTSLVNNRFRELNNKRTYDKNNRIAQKKIIRCDNEHLCEINMTGLNVRKISNKLFIENLSQVRKRTFYMQGYFSSYPNDLAIWTW